MARVYYRPPKDEEEVDTFFFFFFTNKIIQNSDDGGLQLFIHLLGKTTQQGTDYPTSSWTALEKFLISEGSESSWGKLFYM